MYSNEAKRRECLNDVIIYNPISDNWSAIVPEGIPFEPRRYHSACVVGRHLVVYGGVNWQQRYLSDLLALNIGSIPDIASENVNPYRWVAVRHRGETPGPLAYHSCQIVLHPDRYRVPSLISLTNLPEIKGQKSKVL